VEINIGILGLGVVGEELAKIILHNQQRIKEQQGIHIQIKKVFVRDISKKRNVGLDPSILTTRSEEVTQNPDINIICECVGGSGTEQTRKMVLDSIQSGKHVIMSSKKVLAKYGEEILNLLQEHQVQYRYDATVGGGIPVTKVIRECFKGEKIKKVVGILNATSNFIYSYMESHNASFGEALKLAQDLGYAENDPTEDIKGYDSLYKLVILTIFSMGKSVNIEKMSTQSFEDISLIDMNYAKELGYRIKPLAVVEDNNGRLTYRVGPCLIHKTHVVATAVSNYNVIVLEGENSGNIGLYGQGAGAKPTASAMFDDLISVVHDHFRGGTIDFRTVKNLRENVDNYYQYTNNLYWRYTVDNKIGVLAKMCNVFMNYGINIEKIIQKDEVHGKIDVVALTHSADEITINKIISELSNDQIAVVKIIPFF
jgi:homoserine dehydrogenase